MCPLRIIIRISNRCETLQKLIELVSKRCRQFILIDRLWNHIINNFQQYLYIYIGIIQIENLQSRYWLFLAPLKILIFKIFQTSRIWNAYHSNFLTIQNTWKSDCTLFYFSIQKRAFAIRFISYKNVVKSYLMDKQ